MRTLSVGSFARVRLVVLGVAAAVVAAALVPVVAASVAPIPSPTPAPTHHIVAMGTFSAKSYAAKASHLPGGLAAALGRDLHETPEQYLADSAASARAIKVLAALKSAGVHVLGSKISGTKLTVNVASSSEKATVDATGATAVVGAPAVPKFSKQTLHTDTAATTPAYGGEGYWFKTTGQLGTNEDTLCSLGFNGYSNAAGAPQFLTAGHCATTISSTASGGTGANLYTQTAPSYVGGTRNLSTSTPLGNEVAGQYAQNTNVDYGIVASGTSVTPQASLYNWGGGNGAPLSSDVWPVQGETAALPGADLCKSGATSGWTCGSVIAVDDPIQVCPDGVTSCPNNYVNSIIASTCALPGDSGSGAVIGNLAAGIDSGGTFSNNSCANPYSSTNTSGNISAFFPMQSVATPSESVDGQQGSNWQLAVAVTSSASVVAPTSGATVAVTSSMTGTITSPTSGSTALLYLDGSTAPFAKVSASSGSWSIPLAGILVGTHSYALAAGLEWSPGTPVTGTITITDPIQTLYASMGGASGSLGAAQGSEQSFTGAGGGLGERFVGGSIMSSPTAGTFALMNGSIRDTYFALGGPSSVLGWPVGAVGNFTANGGGTAQSFQGGSIVYTSSGGTVSVTGAISTLSVSLGGPAGVLGPAQTAVQSFTGAGGGVGQRFTGGSVMSSPTAGTFAVLNGAIRDTYFNAGGPSSSYGWPTAEQTCSGSACSQTFQGGTIAPPPPDAIQTLYASMGGAASSLGAAQGAEQSFTGAGGGTGERYVGGSIMSSPTAGTFAVMNGSIRDTYFNAGGPSSVLGWPTSALATFTANGGGSSQSFQNGSIVLTTSGGTDIVSGAISTLSASMGGPTGTLGPAQTAVQTFSGAGGGVGQRFTGGSVMSSPTAGTFAIMNGAIRDTYFAAGGPSSTYGWPTAAQTCSGVICSQTFQDGTITPPPPDAIQTLYASMGGASGSLGGLQGGEQPFTGAGGGTGQRYVGGSIMSSPTAGTFAIMNGSIRDTYFNAGGPSGVFGWPTSVVANFTANGGGTAQSFQGGSIVYTSTGGTVAVTGVISTLSISLGGPTGTLGPAQTAVQTFSGAGGGIGQRFTGGSAMSSATAGAFAVLNGAIRNTYFNAGGPSSIYGWPIAEQTCSGASCTQAFQGGTIHN